MPLITLDHLPWIIGVGASVGFVGCVTRTLLLLLTWRPWHKQPSSPLLGEEGPFDFILVGAGSGGAVLAARLVDRGFRVLLLEAGEKDSGPFFKVPIAALGYQATDHHWGYEAEEQEELTMQGAHWGGPSVQGCRGRPLILTRGRAVGGSSSINLCNYVRGHPSEFDAWADELGLEGWSSREMLADYHAAEGLGGAAPAEDRDRPTARRGAAPPAVLLERVRPTHALSTAFVTSCKRLLGGHAPSHALEPPAEGAALHWQSISGGVRCSNARLLHSRRAADAQAKGQLRVETGVRVLRVLLAPSAEPSEPNDAAGDAAAADTAAGGGGRARVRAVGVLAEHERHGTRVELRATREVVLCAGAINSPHLLLLSGIGPTEQLERHGIRTHVDLPGVGESLRDVGQIGVVAHTAYATIDKQLRSPWTYLRYLLFRSGPLASNTLEASCWLSQRTLAKHASSPQPNLAAATDVAEWERLRRILDSSSSAAPDAATAADGAAAAFPWSARHEAAAKLVSNHDAVLRDLTNTVPPPTQAHLRTLPVAQAPHVDALLRHLTGKLLGCAAAADKVSEGDDATRRAAWDAAATLLHHRLQTKAEQRPGRAPDLSEGAGSALRAVLSEVQSVTPAGKADDTAVAAAAPSAPPVTREAAPAMQLLIQPLLFPFASWGKFRTLVEGLKRGTLPSAFTIHIVLLKPRSVGHVRLSNSHALSDPLIDPRYMSVRGDVDELVAGVRIARRLLADGGELRPCGELLPGNGCTTDAELEAYVRANACHLNGSLCGSCRMGHDALAVVDARLCVRGVDGLRIADASVLPTLVSGQLNATVTAVAERAACLLASAHAHAGGQAVSHAAPQDRGSML